MFLQNGFNGFVSKPIDIQELNKILKQWLPAEKLPQCEGTDNAKKEPVSFLEALNKIGLDTKLSMGRLGNKEDLYRKMVEDFPKRLLAQCSEMSTYIREKDFAKFTIPIHTIKSSLGFIGAMKLFEEAAKLEAASKEKDFDYCVKMFPDFQEKLLLLHGQLDAVFQKEAR